MSTTSTHPITPLRTLYLGRSVFAILWAVLLVLSVMLSTAGTLNPLTATLLVLYPVADLVAAAIDRRTAGSAPSTLLVVNIVLSLAAAVGLVVATLHGPSPVLLVWGLWAITAGPCSWWSASGGARSAGSGR